MNLPVEIAVELRSEIQRAAVVAGSQWLTAKDAAAYCGVSERTIRNMQWANKLPVYRFDDNASFIRFKRTDLDALMKPVSATNNKPTAE